MAWAKEKGYFGKESKKIEGQHHYVIMYIRCMHYSCQITLVSSD
jgi:hypothetical protein